MYLLRATDISHSFDYELFSNLSLSLKTKEKIAITGVSGSGKSTFLHILATLLKPTKGDVNILSKDIASLNMKQLNSMRSKEIGIIFQAHYLFKGFSALENVKVVSILSGTDLDEQLFKKLNISHVMNNKISNLSGGQQQRVSIARVLTKKPAIIFADEPTGNLDAKTANELMDIFDDYIIKNNAGFIIVTHDDSIANKCDKIFHLENKELNRVK